MKIGASNTASKETQGSSTQRYGLPAKRPRVEVGALAANGRAVTLSVHSALDQAPSRPSPTPPRLAPAADKQGPFARLPLEVTAKILSWLKSEGQKAQQIPRAVSRAFYQASAVGLPEVNDRIASGYLRKVLRQENFTQVDALETFFVEHAPKMRAIDLGNSYQQKDALKADLLHRLLSRPEFTFNSIDLRGCAAIVELPQELTKVSEDFDLSGTGITQLPQELSVGGSLDLGNTGITQLPRRLSVGRDLFLDGTGITQLPQGLSVGGSLDLSDTDITQLPQGLSVGRDLFLEGTGITQLPQGLSVGGSLGLSHTGITQLPQGLSVGRDLLLSATGMTQVPQGLSVGGSLDLSFTGITQLPLGLSFGGSLFLDNTGISELPQGLSVSGDLDLRGTGITRLPQGLSVGKNLYLRGTGIIVMPRDAKASGQVFQ